MIFGMTLRADSTSRAFEPGTTGWTAADLDDPQIESLWFQGAYEIIEGVLTKMPPAYFVAGRALADLMFCANAHLLQMDAEGAFAAGVEIIADELRVLHADGMFLTPADEARQAQAAIIAGRPDPRRTRLLVPPTLIIESVTPDHELHDRRTKRRWYAEFGVPNYWLLDAFDHSLECLVLEGSDYRVEAIGRNDDELRPSLFPGLVIGLRELWGD
jgi:Uma2 family endonuclease